MADNLYSRYGNSDSNTEGPLRFVDIGSVYYAVSILAKADGTLVDAATSAKQDTIIGHLDGVEGLLTTIDTDTGGIATSAASIDGKITACNTGAVVVSSSALPSGAATAAKQPALGTAGTASADVITVQGIASMTALKVDGSAVTQPVSIASAVAVTDNSGSLTVDAPVGTPVFVRLSDGSSAITTLPVSLASVPSHAVTNAGTFAVQAAQSGTWNVGTLTSITNAVAVTDNSSSLTVDMPAVTTGGASIYRSLDLDETEEEVKSSAGTLYGGIVMNLATSVRYLKFYDGTAASVTVGSTTPVMTIPIPTQAGTANGAGFTIPIPPCGVSFSNAITVAATTGVADNDTGAPGANEVVLNLFYK